MPDATKKPLTHFVKVKGPEDKRFDFLGGNGCAIHLRIHAAMFTQARAEQVAAEIERDMPGYTARAVPIDKK